MKGGIYNTVKSIDNTLKLAKAVARKVHNYFTSYKL